MRLSRVIGAWILLLAIGVHAAAAGVVDTLHNLSASGPGDLTAPEEERVCVFCHTPHHASAITPLWSRDLGGAAYDLYASSTLNAAPGQPTGASRLCLSCHDGTIALGLLHGGYQIATLGAIPSGRTSNLSTDLSDDHPISFAYTSALAQQNGELHDPSSLPPEIQLEPGAQLQCTACHDAHKNPYGKFLVMDNTASALCVSCHNKDGWYGSTHAVDASVGGQGCENCHLPHNAGGPERLLRAPREEDNCLSCHDEAGIESDVASSLGRLYSHPVDAASGVHEPDEDPLTAAFHVECADCHAPHAVNGEPAAAPYANGRLQGVPGVDRYGAVVPQVQYEYEVCFRCHADNTMVTRTAVPRQVEEVNLRLRFDPSSAGFHPVVASGLGSNVPSLRPEVALTSRIYCSDCHGNDQGMGEGGSEGDGPHGSNYPHILRARYDQDTYPQAYAASNYALCYRCHDPQPLLDGVTSPFSPHARHVVEQGVACSLCHDPHGVPFSAGGTAGANAHLINFDTRFVTAVYDAALRTCTASCHATPSTPRSY